MFTCDQQRYRVAVNISRAQPDRSRNMALRLGGIRFLMSFIGCVGSLLAVSGLVEIMSCAFLGVGHMLAGKNFAHNFRAL